jgi:hypothetical protein
MQLALLLPVVLAAGFVGCGGTGAPAPDPCRQAGASYEAALSTARACTPGASTCTLRPTSDQQATWCVCQVAVDSASAAGLDALYAHIPRGCSRACPPCPNPGAAGAEPACRPDAGGATGTCG